MSLLKPTKRLPHQKKIQKNATQYSPQTKQTENQEGNKLQSTKVLNGVFS